MTNTAPSNSLLQPERLWTRSEVLSRPCPIPKSPGVYAWYFKEPPPGVPTGGCHTFNGMTLLYVGISPKADPKNGAKPSKQTLRPRLKQHYDLNAEGSTLRMTLGSLLQQTLGIQLRRVGSGQRMTFTAPGESALSEWMSNNAFVCWIETERPWHVEDELIARLTLPLNLLGNDRHPFHPTLSAVRRAARAVARDLPVVDR